ncbi:hypothetical protein D6829_02035 [Candidatus Pacearchaeota archaeon]|nr:MAG: hypothetical protein D6829_02035 [Candidatus Pacearchaeota archaeon]
MGKVIGIMSFKGGVGKTTAAINLAAALYRLGRSALIIDGNFLSPNLHLYLGLLRPEKTLKDVLQKGIAPENAIYEHACGIHILPCEFYKSVNFEKFHKMVLSLKEKYDFVILDSGPSYTEEIIAVLISSDELLFVATPDYPSLASTVKARKLAKFKGLPIRGVVVNRRKKKRFELKNSDIEKTIGIGVLCEIPDDNSILKSVKKFSPVVWKYRRSKSSRAFMKLAKVFFQG